MKKEEIMKNVSTTFSKVSVKLKKHSPEILIVAGVVGTVEGDVARWYNGRIKSEFFKDDLQ